MSNAVEGAFESGQGIILEDDLGNRSGVFSGVDLPEIEVPDAPIASLYLRSNGKVYSRNSDTSLGEPTDWQEGTGGSVTSSLEFPFCLTTGLPDNIPLQSGKLPFYLSNGSASFIEPV